MNSASPIKTEILKRLRITQNPSALTIAVAALVFLLTLCTLWFRLSTTRIAQIERVLAADSQAPRGAKTVDQIAQRMRSINIAECPDDFQAAYISHIHAWEQAADLERQMAVFQGRFTSTNALIESFARGLVFDFSMVAEEAEEKSRLRVKYEDINSRILATYQEVEKVTVRHGAKLPQKSMSTTTGTVP